MSIKGSQSTKMSQANQVNDFFDDDEETPYYVWTEMMKTEGEGEQAIEYFDDSVLEEGSPEDKTSKEDASASYATVPMSCRYITAVGEVTGIFMFELPEKYYTYGISCMPSKGKINYSIMCRWSKNDPTDVRFVDGFTAGLYQHFVNKTAENEWHYRAGGDEEFDPDKPSKYLRPWIRYPKDKNTKKPKTDADKQWYITLLNTRDEKTVFSVPYKEGEKPHPIEWKRLEGLALTMIVTVQCASIYLGASKVCPQFRAVSAIISKKPKRGGRVVNTKTANRLAKENPGLAPSINHIIDSIDIDNPASAGGFTSSVKGEGEGDEGEEGDDYVKTTSVRAGGRGGGVKGNIEGFINSGKMRGGASAPATGGRGAGTGRGAGGRGGGASAPAGGRGTTVINRRPPPTPSKIPTYEEEGDGEADGGEESYD